MRIYGAFNAAVRPLVLVVAAASKVGFIALVLSNGDRHLHTQAGLSIAVDSLMVIIFAAYLGIGTRHPPLGTHSHQARGTP